MKRNYKMLGVVVLYNPDLREVVENMERYVPYLDRLIVWDNSPINLNLRDIITRRLQEFEDKIQWQGTGENRFIAPAINFAWRYAKENEYDFILTMDQDSRWLDFMKYRQLIENDAGQNLLCVYTPYIKGCDQWIIRDKKQKRRIFINSGTVYPVEILTAIGGVDETFLLDALDHDTAIRVQEAGYDIVCLTDCILLHTMGNPTKSRLLLLKANNYSAGRTYEITRSHILNFRKHRKWLTFSDKVRIIKDFVVMRLFRILLLEKDKFNKIKMLIRGLKAGLTARI